MNNKLIVDYLTELIPNPKPELNYNKDYELLIAVMLSAQTTDRRVNMVTNILFNKYTSLEALANANIEDIKLIIKPLGTYNVKSKNVIAIATSLLNDQNGVVPNNREYLEKLSGVGRKTTNVVLALLFNESLIAVDTHVARVSKRLKIASLDDDVLLIEKKLVKKFSNYDLNILHHQLLLFGRYYCKAIKPLCDNCKFRNMCKKNIK